MRRITIFAPICALLCVGMSLPASAESEPAREAEARAPIEAFFAGFNAKDIEAIRKSLHYPHVRLASGTVAVAQTAEEYSIPYDLLEATGWRRSTLDSCLMRQNSEGKVHFEIEFTRYNEKDEPYALYKSLWISEFKDGRWGIRARSSFAP